LVKLEKEVNKMPDDIGTPGDVAQETPAIDKGKDLDLDGKVNALMDYIATTPQNINYNIVREISKAIILDEKHPYFDYYMKKITANEETEEPGKPGKIDDDSAQVLTP
jgi:hypothetical protein